MATTYWSCGCCSLGLRLEAHMSVLELKTILKREREADCDAREIRLFQGKKRWIVTTTMTAL